MLFPAKPDTVDSNCDSTALVRHETHRTGESKRQVLQRVGKPVQSGGRLRSTETMERSSSSREEAQKTKS